MPWDLLAIALPDAACVAFCVIAAVVDARHYRIPNWLTGSAVVVALLLNVALQLAAGGTDAALRVGLGMTAIGGGIMLLVAAPLGAARLLGMGDVKLLVAVGSLVRWPLALHALLYIAIAGGVLALALAMARGVLPRVAHNLAGGRDLDIDSRHRMPYGVAILFGVVWAVTARYLAAVRLLG